MRSDDALSAHPSGGEYGWPGRGASRGFTYCRCGKCESSRRGMPDTVRKYRPPEPPKWLK